PGQTLRETLAEVEMLLIEQAMRQSENNISQAAALLGIPRQTLQYRLRALHLA
ncbi:MAG TPA: sigma-54-dependent Fis family transcriptional regulator, partial [Firmicutes bacterium]|nr:sigma-54-dependent Fis family transcriptional regulator [Bacillota bacterium]